MGRGQGGAVGAVVKIVLITSSQEERQLRRRSAEDDKWHRRGDRHAHNALGKYIGQNCSLLSLITQIQAPSGSGFSE